MYELQKTNLQFYGQRYKAIKIKKNLQNIVVTYGKEILFMHFYP